MEKNSQETLEKILRHITRNKKSGETYFIGIDGGGGAGKSTFASQLAPLLPSSRIIHMDHFDIPFSKRLKLPPTEKPIGADSDWKRLISDALLPLSQNQEAIYQCYDWDTDSMGKYTTIEPREIVIVEGVYAIRKELLSFYDLTIWLECPKDIRFKRGIARDGKSAIDRWVKDWIPMEDRYIDVQKPIGYADIVIKNY